MFKLKKFLLVFLAFILPLLASCTKGINKRSVTVNRPSGKVSVEYGGNCYTAQIHYSDTGEMTANMLSPLKNVSITVGYSGCEIAYDGMKIEYSAEQTESFCPFLRLYSLLKTVCYTEPEVVRLDGNNYILKFNDGGKGCKAVTDADGTLTRLEADGLVFSFV